MCQCWTARSTDFTSGGATRRTKDIWTSWFGSRTNSGPSTEGGPARCSSCWRKLCKLETRTSAKATTRNSCAFTSRCRAWLRPCRTRSRRKTQRLFKKNGQSRQRRARRQSKALTLFFTRAREQTNWRSKSSTCWIFGLARPRALRDICYSLYYCDLWVLFLNVLWQIP